MRNTPLLLSIGLILTLTVPDVGATVTMQFSQTNVARATGFANNLGTPTNGMRWGIVIDSQGDGYSGGSYDVFDFNTSAFLLVSGVPTDDYYVAHPTSALTTTATSTPTIPSGTDPGGAGAIASMTNVAIAYGSSSGGGTIGSTDPFAVIWFETAPANGSYYGMLPNLSGTADFRIPNDGDTVSYAAFFAGTSPDPAKPANLQFGTPIPEPSRLMLLGLGALGIFARRRRS